MAATLLAAALLPALLATVGVAVAPDPIVAHSSAAPVAAIAEGEALYAFHCAVCHGVGGGGLTEARLAFPADHRRCTQCHKPNNPVVAPLDRPIVDNDMFSIGDPPPLHALGTGERTPMPATAAPEALFAYVRATMPRYHPGRLADHEYWLITAFLLDLNARTEAAAGAADRALANGWAAPEPASGATAPD